ncbi:hypothetical protein B0J14DRAFT_650023 [Halenospora varia]|nr:hypothetical protein B0J14DRAFT_650023 [Halenospora varia]
MIVSQSFITKITQQIDPKIDPTDTSILSSPRKLNPPPIAISFFAYPSKLPWYLDLYILLLAACISWLRTPALDGDANQPNVDRRRGWRRILLRLLPFVWGVLTAVVVLKSLVDAWAVSFLQFLSSARQLGYPSPFSDAAKAFIDAHLSYSPFANEEFKPWRFVLGVLESHGAAYIGLPSEWRDGMDEVLED